MSSVCHVGDVCQYRVGRHCNWNGEAAGWQTRGVRRRCLWTDKCRLVLVRIVSCLACLGSARANPRPSWCSVRRGILTIPYLVLCEGAPNCPKWAGPGMRCSPSACGLHGAASESGQGSEWLVEVRSGDTESRRVIEIS